MSGIQTLRVGVLSVILASCAASPAPETKAAPADAATAENAAARQAVVTALSSLGKRNFEVGNCEPVELRLVSEAEVRAGAPVGDRCSMLVVHRADHTWLLSVRPATHASPTKAGGALAVVAVTADGGGVTHIDYVP